jgi:hypothetical protein
MTRRMRMRKRTIPAVALGVLTFARAAASSAAAAPDDPVEASAASDDVDAAAVAAIDKAREIASAFGLGACSTSARLDASDSPTDRASALSSR